MRLDHKTHSYDTATDLICGVEVDQKEAESRGHYADHAGQRHWFCSNACKTQFELAPNLHATIPATSTDPHLTPDHL